MNAPQEARALLAKLRRIRETKGLSQSQVAARMGRSVSSVSMLETGLRDPQLSTVLRYMWALGFRMWCAPGVNHLRFLGTRDSARAIERFAGRYGFADQVRVNGVSLSVLDGVGDPVPLRVGQCVVIADGELMVTASDWYPALDSADCLD